MPSTPHLDAPDPWCAVCGSAAVGPVHAVDLARGVRVGLCAEHRTAQFMTHDGGRALVGALARSLHAVGALSAQRRLGLEAYVRRVESANDAPPRRRPGSYAWPALHAEVLRRRDAGETFEAVMADVRLVDPGPCDAPPSEQTVRRWWRTGPIPAGATT